MDRYEEAVRQMIADGQISQEVVEKYFPELKESEDERIRKVLIEIFSSISKKYCCDIPTEKIIAWLEKQGGQKHADKVEPKFKVGDWITIKE